MTEHKVTPERLQQLLTYDSTLGVIRTERKRKILPDESGLVTIWDKDLKTRRKLLYKNLAWILGNKREVPDGTKVLCLNLNEEDVSLRNLKIVESSAYRDIQIALRNLNGVLRIAQHPEDKHAYHLIWSEYKKECKAVHYDIGSAEEHKRQKEKEFVKFINKYIVSE
jgi:hypothetical protein